MDLQKNVHTSVTHKSSKLGNTEAPQQWSVRPHYGGTVGHSAAGRETHVPGLNECISQTFGKRPTVKGYSTAYDGIFKSSKTRKTYLLCMHVNTKLISKNLLMLYVRLWPLALLADSWIFR